MATGSLVIKSALLLAIAPVAVVLLLWAFQRRLMYFPSSLEGTPSDAGLERAETISFAADDGVRLAGWFVRADRAPAVATVVVLNGNAGNRAFRAPLAAALAGAGFNVLLFDYRGYGGNSGSPTEAGLVADARAARQYVESRPEVDPQRIALFGESLGAAPAVAIAAERAPAALILRSPFTSMVDVARVHYGWLPVQMLLRDRYASIDRIGAVRCPLLVIAGDRDTIIPIDQSRRLYAAGPSSKRFVVVPGADHNDWSLLAGDRLIRETVSFLIDEMEPR